MTRIFVAVAIPAILIGAEAPRDAFDGPEQAARGERLFNSTAKPVACVTCHSIGGTLPTPGPDLKIWARISPRAVATTITTALTDKSVAVQMKTGARFPATKAAEDDKEITFFDLSKKPPELRVVSKVAIYEMKPNRMWKHPPGTENYSAADLADLIAYIRWMGARDATPVEPESLQ
jgi:hypothetical protein